MIMNKYDKVERTFVFSIDNEEEEKSAKHMVKQNGLCTGVHCITCPFSLDLHECYAESRDDRLELLKMMGVKK